MTPMTPQTFRPWVWLVALTLIISLGAMSVAVAFGDTTLTPDVSEALKRYTGGYTYANQAERVRDQAKLFANNDAINAARINNDISDAAYQAAQSDFDKLNTKFGQRAARAADAEFTVQARGSSAFSPGTDSDYITIVKNKEQIAKMQSDYNRRVNEFLTENGAIDAPRSNWQNKLDTDFMADPRHVSEAEFREIAKMNNDAYKRRASADFERISRQKGGGKIGPEHVTAYTEDMADFVAKKRGKIADLFKDPSNFNDPVKRAKAIQMMAQEQKYISRLESLDDHLRAQEGLPPRNRGITIAKQGSIRDPANIKGIKGAHSVASASQASAVDDLVETMSEIAEKNPSGAFGRTAADEIATVIAQAPAEHRAAAIAKLSRANPELAAAVKRSPNFSAVDDIVRTGEVRGLARAGEEAGSLSRSAARAGEELGEIAKTSRIRKGLTAAGETMRKLGEVAVRVDAALAVAKIAEWSATVNKALDPNISDEEAAALFEKAEALSEQIAETGLIIPLLEHHPYIAGAYLTWTVACVAGEWVVQNKETGEFVGRSKGTCLDRQMSAWDEMVGTYGTQAERDAQNKALCDKVKMAVKEGRVQIKWPYDESDVCNSLKRGEKVGDMLENPTGPGSTAQLCANIKSKIAAATGLARKGDLATAQGLLVAARSKLNDADTKACADLDGQITAQQSRIDGQAATQRAQAEDALSKCQFTESYPKIQRLPDGAEKAALLARWNKAQEVNQAARDMIAQAKTMEDRGDAAGAANNLQKAKDLEPCGSIVAKIDEAIARLVQTGIANAEAALGACDFKTSRELIASLPDGGRPQTLVDRWNSSYEIERSARDLLTAAVALKDQEPKAAIAKLQQARDLGPCENTLAAIDKAIGDIETKIAEGEVRKAEAALNNCEFKESRQLIQVLPEGPRRDGLVARWNRTYETERKARDLVKEAMSLKDQGEFSKAVGKLHVARDLPPCDSTVTAIDRAIVEIQSSVASADSGRAEAALDACHFKESRQLIRDLPEGPRRDDLVARWNRAYETERRARDLVEEGMSLQGQGELSKAVGKLHVARDLQPCDSTVAAIDRAVASIQGTIAERERAQGQIGNAGQGDPYTEPGRRAEGTGPQPGGPQCGFGVRPDGTCKTFGDLVDVEGLSKSITGLGETAPAPRGCVFARDCSVKPSDPRWCNAADWARWNAFLECKRRSR